MPPKKKPEGPSKKTEMKKKEKVIEVRLILKFKREIEYFVKIVFFSKSRQIQNFPLIETKFIIDPFLLVQNSKFTPFCWVKTKNIPLFIGSIF